MLTDRVTRDMMKETESFHITELKTISISHMSDSFFG
jgi:hypothetical protein